jgi:putative Flp pilus-assembly TadE/G-like protein
MRMCSVSIPEERRNLERGSTLFIVAASLTLLLGIAALAVDLASLYVARSESQRAADAAALAGAKVFVESGCVTSGDCSAQEGAAAARAAQIASQDLVEGQPVTVSGITFTETSQNPHITVQIQSPNLRVYFAGAIGVTNSPTVTATATAEAFNPSGQAGAPQFCTGCVRPWLIPNCDPSGNCLLTGSHAVANPGPGCTGVVGQPLQIAIGTLPSVYRPVDDGTGLAGYQKSIATCNTGQMTCGSIVNTLPGSTSGYTGPGIGALLHISANNAGPGLGQDRIDTTVCPPQIHAGARNPLVVQGVIAEDALVATSDSIVTAYLYQPPAQPSPPPPPNTWPLNPNVSQPVSVFGFVQVFITQVDQNGDVWGVILGVAGCASSDTDCEPGALKGSNMLPIRLITPGT